MDEISQVQSKPTTNTIAKARMLLDYASTYPNAILCYHDIQMILHISYDMAYLVMTKVHSCYAGHFYLRYWPRYKSHKLTKRRNGPILTTCKTISNFVTSENEA